MTHALDLHPVPFILFKQGFGFRIKIDRVEPAAPGFVVNAGGPGARPGIQLVLVAVDAALPVFGKASNCGTEPPSSGLHPPSLPTPKQNRRKPFWWPKRCWAIEPRIFPRWLRPRRGIPPIHFWFPIPAGFFRRKGFPTWRRPLPGKNTVQATNQARVRTVALVNFAVMNRGLMERVSSKSGLGWMSRKKEEGEKKAEG